MKDFQEISSKVIDILHRHQVKRASLFGSVVRGGATKDSDIDLLVEFEGKKSLLDLDWAEAGPRRCSQTMVRCPDLRFAPSSLKDRLMEEQEATL